jgi:hypothetical protein
VLSVGKDLVLVAVTVGRQLTNERISASNSSPRMSGAGATPMAYDALDECEVEPAATVASRVLSVWSAVTPKRRSAMSARPATARSDVATSA